MRVIELRGARTNNLKRLDLDIQPGSLVVVTGPSGAGKSSLAFGTLYAEGQRRYVESFSAYARQFLERLARPEVDRLDPVPAAIAVDRRAPVKTSRSTVATLIEITDYAQQLWAAASTLVCTQCSANVVSHSPESAVQDVLESLSGQRLIVAYPLPVIDAEHFIGVREALARDGYRRLWVDGTLRELDDLRPSDVLGSVEAAVKPARRRKAKAAESAPPPPPAATLHVVTDRLAATADARPRLAEALEAAFDRGAGRAEVFPAAGGCKSLSAGLACDACGAVYKQPTPGMFSYNSPIGACPGCRGFGRVIDVDWDKVVPDRKKTLAGGAIRPWSGKSTQYERSVLERYCKRAGVPMDVPYAKLSKQQTEGLIEGDGGNWRTGFPGLRRWFKWMETRAYKMHVRVLLSRYRKYIECDRCQGSRFKPEVNAFKLNGRTLPEFYALSVRETLEFLQPLAAQLGRDPSLAQILSECQLRLSTLAAVGLHYLTLDRGARTLSGGELQRVSLTSALGASLTGTMFVLDEPTVGLHPADVATLLPVVRQLARGDNVVIVIESDEHFLHGADRVLELGPGAGERGGEIVFDGTPAEYMRTRAPSDAAFVTALARSEAATAQGALRLSGATGNNLANVELEIPLRALTCVTGVSGSGKSSLVLDTLVPAVQRALGDASAAALPFESVSGFETLKSVVFVDQAPLGRTSRGNPATYLGAWDVFRRLFARDKLAQEREYTPGTFSFNVPGGRCEACKGEGAETVEMQFLSDVTFSCPQCAGRRFLGPVLDVTLGGCNVAEVLELSAIEAAERYASNLDISARLQPLIDVGAGYLRLGQALNTLSGGEAQRLKLAAALAGATKNALIVLDEPTAGLHAFDTLPLLQTLRALVKRGNTVVLVEHDMRVAAASDHVIDLGPGAGALGGRIVARGTPVEVAAQGGDGKTAAALRGVLERRGGAEVRAQGRDVASRLRMGPAAGSGEPSPDVIAVRGAREHNLRDLDVDVPRDKLVVVTGPSGSGKSTLAFDVIFAESQRRYLETLSPYVRQYLKQLPRPAVDRVIGAPPSISLEQRSTGGARNSTIATVTEVAHHLRVMFARAGRLHCPDCALPIEARSVAALAEHARSELGAGAVSVWAPIVRGRKGAHRDLLSQAMRSGVARARIDGKIVELTRGLSLDRFKEHDVDLELGSAKPGSAELVALLEQSVARSEGSVRLIARDRELLLSTRRACPKCSRGFPELDPRFFSFNTRQGACPECDGQGEIEVEAGARRSRDVHRNAKSARGDLNRGEHRARATEPVRVPCRACDGKRLAGLALHTFLDGARITELLSLDVTAARERLSRIALQGREARVAELPLREALLRLSFLERVGLEYLTLDRPAWSLSGGELQRVRLAAQLGSGLTGLLYVLDEPTIGLHPRDTDRLLRALRDLTGKGCSVLLVEHDAETIRAADHVIDVGPGGGHTGGRILAQGSPAELARNPASLTFASLARPLASPERRRPIDPKRGARLIGATEHNLKNVDLWIPAGRLSVVSGVSGSGKSTLVRDVFLRAVRAAIGLQADPPGAHREIRGATIWKSAVEIDQTPIGRTPRSVPATYVGVWNELRALYASTPEARARGYTATRFSFNTKQGRCEACEGQGATSFEMAFLPEALVPCEACAGLRFNPETLSVHLHGVSAGQLLAMDVGEVAQLFTAVPKVRKPLDLLARLGLSYLKLGQPSNSLSGGEAQRLKLVSELAARGAGPTLYVMDEPTTGLHREDVQRLLAVLQELVERGDTVLVIEHHPDLILAADYVIDLGPEGGSGGGTIVAQGTPEEIMRVRASHTGRILKRELTKVRSSQLQDGARAP